VTATTNSNSRTRLRSNSTTSALSHAGTRGKGGMSAKQKKHFVKETLREVNTTFLSCCDVSSSLSFFSY
jgi:hypothetical protein